MAFVFQYGSNCDATRLNSPDRLGGVANDCGLAQMTSEYDIAFDIWSRGNGCAVADLVAASNTGLHPWGVLYEIPDGRLFGRDHPTGRTLEQIEGPRYQPTRVRVRKGSGDVLEAVTFTIRPNERVGGLWTSAEYVGHIVSGLRAHLAPETWTQHIIDVAIHQNRVADDRQAAAPQIAAIERLRG
jgi:hypothetical protein